jgi:hypothetical protein
MALAGFISAVLCDSLLNLLWRELPAQERQILSGVVAVTAMLIAARSR